MRDSVHGVWITERNLGDSMKTMMTPNGWAGGSRLRGAQPGGAKSRLGLSLEKWCANGALSSAVIRRYQLRYTMTASHGRSVYQYLYDITAMAMKTP